MAPTKLKIKGNKAFSLLSIETDEDLSKTWRLMTKVKDALEYGMRLENLSWRLWFMHHLMVHDPKSQTHFRKLSTATTKKLENEKANDIKDLAAPLYRPPKPQELLEKKAKKKIPKKATAAAASTTGSQVKKKNVKNVKPVVESISTEIPTPSTSNNNNINDNNIETSDHSQTDYGNNDEMITTVNDQNNAELLELEPLDDNMNLNIGVEMFRFSDVNQDFILRQYTNDQDPYQVVSLPGLFTRTFNAHAILDPNNPQPTMMVELNDVFSHHPHHHHFYSSDSSEPTSPDGLNPEWFPTQNTEMQYQINNSQLVSRTTSSAGLLHDAVYVRNTDHTPVNLNVSTMTLNTSHETPLNTPLSTPLSTPTTTMPIMSGLYMNQFPSEQNNSTLGQQQQRSSKSVTTSPTTSSQSSMDVSVVSHPSVNNTISASTSTSECNKPKKAHSNGEQQCFNCGVTSTPLWRRSANDELLCNACGLYLKLHKMARPKTMKPHIVRKDARDDEAAQPVCSNCGTMTTPLWRRDEEGQTLCNACGLYFKLHHERRPLSMKTDVIKKRQRYENGQTPNRRGGKKQRSHEQEVQQQQQQQQQQQPSPPPPPPQTQQPPPPPPPSSSQQSQSQAQAIYNEPNGSMTVPTTTVSPVGPISVGQSSTMRQSPTTTTSVNGGY